MAPQVPRLALVFGLLTTSYFVARSQLVPSSFGEKGFYRNDFPAELASLPFAHAGKQACAKCHPEKEEATKHVINGVSCESCHGPSQRHVESFDEFKPYVPSKRSDCGRCHASVAGRRASFPQQDLKEHNPGEICTTCHTVHDSNENTEETE